MKKSLKEILTSDGRNIVQGLIGWLWARSSITIPIPGFSSKKQLKELLESIKYGPLNPEQMSEIEKISKDSKNPKDLRNSSYTELGATLGTPAGINLNIGYIR